MLFSQSSEENRRDPPALGTDVLKILLAHDWPGNVRELENCIERAVVLADGQPLNPELFASLGAREQRARAARNRSSDLPALIQNLVRVGVQSYPGEDARLYDRLVGEVERELIQQVLLLCDNVQVKAAARLGINRNTLHKKISEFTPAAKNDEGRSPNDERSPKPE